jgi:hypothetical protein
MSYVSGPWQPCVLVITVRWTTLVLIAVFGLRVEATAVLSQRGP